MASKAIGFLNFKFSADLTAFERAMNKAQKKLKRFGKSVERTGKNMTMGLTLPIVGLGIASVKAFDEQAKAIAQVEAGLKSTAGTIGLTSKELQKMAADLQKTSLFGDEEILSDVTAQLLTFTGIAKSQFGEAQLAVVNLSTKLKTDLKSTAIMVGKALNDPVTQLSALSRNGVKFTEDQTALIKSLVEMGDIAGAQTIILKELETQFGGSAEAARKAGMGPLQAMQMQLSDLSEQIGERLMPFIMKFTGWILKLAEKFDGLTGSQKDNIVKWGLIAAAIGPVLIIIGKLSIGIGALIGVFKGLMRFIVANPYIALAVGITAAVTAVNKFILANDGLTSSQRMLNEVNSTAQKSILSQQIEVENLTGILKDENKTLEEKETALANLNAIAPAYYGSINAAALDVKKLDSATQDYISTLLVQAELQAGEQKLLDLMSERIDLQTQMKKLTGTTATLKMLAGTVIPGLGFEDSANYLLNIKRQKELNSEIEAMTNLIQKNTLKQQKNNETKVEDTQIITEESIEIANLKTQIERLTEANEKLRNKTNSTTESIKQYSIAADPLLKKIKEYSIISKKLWSDKGIQEGPENLLNWTEKLTDAQKLLNAGTGLFSDILTDSLNSAFDSQENFFSVFVDNIKKAIRQLLIQLAVMTIIQSLMGGGAAAFSLPSILSNLGSIMNVQLADGGLVTGPTTALIGEVSTASNPEVVAPLDKLKSMMGGGSSNVTVQGRLVGSDIFLSNERTKFNRNRTV